MKSIQKIILIKIIIILSIAFAIINVSQLHINNNNNNNKINLKRRDTKFYVQDEIVVSFNNHQNDNNNAIPNISIDTNDNNKNTIINQLNIESSIDVKSSEDLIISQESSSPSSVPVQIDTIDKEAVIPTSYDNMMLNVDTDVKFVPGEAPKYSNRNLDC